MKYFLESILPRLKKVSASLDQSALLVDKPWVVTSGEKVEQGSTTKLIFRENGRLHVSVEGVVHDGSWEYLPEANAVLIEQRGQKRLYKHAYLDEAVLALVKDTSGQDNEYYLLADDNLVPDGDVLGYLAEKFDGQKNLEERSLAARGLSGGDELLGKYDKSSVTAAANKKTGNTIFLYTCVIAFIFMVMALLASG